jgi:DNA-binding LacI/PurR family transcriptional regulator
LIVTGINQTAESRTILESMNCPVTQIMEIGDSPVDMMVGFSHYDASFAAISHILEQGAGDRISRRANGPARPAAASKGIVMP